MNRTKVKILIVGILMVLVLLWMILPNFMRARTMADMNTCLNHLQQIDGAKQLWAKEHNKNANDIPTWNDLKPYLGLPFPVCPDGGIYTLGRVADAPKCSIPGHYLN
jgi:hypothetical protein